MRSAMTQPEAERFDAAMKVAATQLRQRETARANTEAAWRMLQQNVAEQSAGQRGAGQQGAGRAKAGMRLLGARRGEFGRHVEDPRVVATPPRRRPSHVWVPIAMGCACVALIVSLVWARSRPDHIEPGQVPDTTVVTSVTPATSAPASTPVDDTLVDETLVEEAPVPGAGGLILPAFPDEKLVASLSAVSDTEWFALSDLGSFNRQSYPLLWHTTDAGATWVDVPLSEEAAGIGDSVYFADSLNGWMGGARCCLASTHDGGATWTRVNGVLPDGVLDAPLDIAITSFGGTVYLLGDVPVNGNSTSVVLSSPIDRDEFVWTGTSMGDARWGLDVHSAQLAVSSQGGWAIGFGVVSARANAPDGATRTVEGEWVTWEPPCAMRLDDEEPYTRIDVPQMALGVSPSGEYVGVVCDAGTDAGFPLVFLSADGGATFESTTPMSGNIRFTTGSWLVVTDDGTMIVGLATDAADLVVQSSTDGGQTWRTEALFGERNYFLDVSVTPAGRLVVVAKSDGPNAARGADGKARQPDGTWVPLATV